MTNLTLDTTVAARRYVLIDEESGELGSDWEWTPEEANHTNSQLRNQGSRWRWFPWAEISEAA